MLFGVFVLAHHRKLKNVTVLKGDIINLRRIVSSDVGRYDSNDMFTCSVQQKDYKLLKQQLFLLICNAEYVLDCD